MLSFQRIAGPFIKAQPSNYSVLTDRTLQLPGSRGIDYEEYKVALSGNAVRQRARS